MRWNLSEWSNKWLGIGALPAGAAVGIQGLSNVVGASNVFGGTCAYLSDGIVKCLGLTSGVSYRSTPVAMASYSVLPFQYEHRKFTCGSLC